MTYMKRLKAVSGSLTAGALIFGIGLVPGTAHAEASTSKESVAVAAVLHNVSRGLSASDWQMIQRNAERAGDKVAAQTISRHLQGRAAGAGTISTSPAARGGSIQPSGIKPKLVKILLRYGGDALAKALKKASPRASKSIGNNANRLANWLDSFGGASELAISTFLVSQGLEPILARDIARWIVLFAV